MKLLGVFDVGTRFGRAGLQEPPGLSRMRAAFDPEGMRDM